MTVSHNIIIVIVIVIIEQCKKTGHGSTRRTSTVMTRMAVIATSLSGGCGDGHDSTLVLHWSDSWAVLTRRG